MMRMIHSFGAMRSSCHPSLIVSPRILDTFLSSKIVSAMSHHSVYRFVLRSREDSIPRLLVSTTPLPICNNKVMVTNWENYRIEHGCLKSILNCGYVSLLNAEAPKAK